MSEEIKNIMDALENNELKDDGFWGRACSRLSHQLQTAKEENKRQHELRLKSERDWDKREKQWVAEAEKAWKSQSSEYAKELEHTIRLRDEQIQNLTQQNKQMREGLNEILKVFADKHYVNGYEHTTLTIVRNVLQALKEVNNEK